MKNRHGPTHTSLSSNNVSNNRTVHIGNIPSVTTIETLQSIFSKYGEITNIKLAGDPSYSKRFAFIEYAEPYQAKSSLCLDGTEYLGQILKISLAKHDFNSRQHQRSSSLNQNKITTTPHHYRTNSEFSTDSDVSSTTSSINISSLTASLPQIPTSNNSTTVSNSSSPKKNNTTNNLIAHSSLSPSTTTNNSTMTQSISPTTTDHGTGNNNESTQQHTHHPQINTSSPSTKNKSTHQHHHTTLNNNNNMVMPQDEMSVISSPLVTSMYLGSPTPASPSSMYIGLPLSQPIVTEQNVVARTIHISGIDIVFTEDELLEYFGVYGDVTNYRLCNNDQISTNSNNQHATKFAFIEYARADQALKALMVNGTLWGKSKLKVSHSKTAIQTPPKKSLIDKQYRDLIERTIHIGGIDVKLSQDSVKAFFEELCGTVHRIAMAGDTESYETRFCFIEFEDKQSALKALRLTGCTIAGSVKQIKVSPSKSPIGYSKNKLMMIGIGSASNPSPPSPLHHQLNQLHLNSHTSPPPPSSSSTSTTTTLIHHAHHPLNHHNTHHLTSTPTTPGNAAFTNAGLVPLGHLAIPANLAQAATASNLALFPTSTTTATTGTTTLPTPTSQNSTNSVTTTASTTATPQSFPTIFPFAPWAYTANTTATLSNQGSMDPSSQGFFSYPQMQMIHPQYYFYTTTPTMTYGAVALPNSSFNTSTSYNLVPTTTQETHTTDQDDTDTDNVKRKRDQHESFDESSNALYQKKLKDK
ncbi:hypothetical protein C9374_001968 [Naegleria lovaniensis]|uniref:RRM domain-containing protein n=1 Tax=Naegleria lovaniensis TaxID=51637 RepID=A0AA88KLR2_NAELO|nr:uncharacterized protein C9374_001968 [Naegleria lovaniensis]KAG2386933.1 hypothetical protein C9374_001968 [Naegleria lovaniensis]